MAYGMSIVEQDELIKTLSDDQLQYYANNPDGRLPLYLVVAQLKRNEDTRGRFSALQAEQQTAQQPRTVVERLAPPRHGEIPVPSSRVAANPAPQIPLQQAGGAPQMPTINAQGGMDFEKMVAAFAKVAAAEQKKEEEVDMRKPDHFGSERRGSFERGGKTPTSQYPATTFAALRKALADEEGSRVHRGRQTRGPYQPEGKGKKGRFTAAARHARELTDRDFYTWNPLKMAMTQGGLAGLSKRRRGRTVNAQDGSGTDIAGKSVEGFRLVEDRIAAEAAAAEVAAMRAAVGETGDPSPPLETAVAEKDVAVAEEARIAPANILFSRIAEEARRREAAAAAAGAPTAAAPRSGGLRGLQPYSSAAAAMGADPDLVLGETPTAQRMIKILERTPEGRKRLEIARDIVSGTDVPPAPDAVVPPAPDAVVPPASDAVVPPIEGYAGQIQAPSSLADKRFLLAEAEKFRLAEAAEQAEEYKRQRVTGEGHLGRLKGDVRKKLAIEGAAPVDLSQLEKNIQKWNDDLLLLQGKLPTPQTAEQRMATHNKWVQPSRDAQYKAMLGAIETQGKASQEHIKSVENAGEAIKEFARTGKLPEGRRDALLNKLLLTWGSALLGNPTLADAMSQGFAASIDVIEGEQKNYAKALTDELQAVKAVGELKMKAADSKAAALRNIANARAADAKQDQQMSVKFMEMANKDIATLMTHKRGMLTLSYQALTARVALLNARKPNAATNQLKALNQAIRTEFGAYIADYDKALKKAEKNKTSPEAATDRINAKYSTHFGMNKSGVLDANEWKPNAPKFAAAARMMQQAGSSTAAQGLWMRFDAAATKATKEVVDGSGAMEGDTTSMKVLEFIARRGGSELKLDEKNRNLSDILGKYKAEINRDFSDLYKSYKVWDAGGRRGPNPLGRGGSVDIPYDRAGKRIISPHG
jgi:hypothetical protein